MDARDKNKGWKEKVLLVVDIFFVMVLCLVVLLITMLIQNHLGGADVSGGYEIRLETLIPVIIAIVGYLLFLVKGGKKGLKEIIDVAYADEKDEVE